MNKSHVKTGLDRLIDDGYRLDYLKNRNVGLLSNPSSITSDLTHAVDALQSRGVELDRLFGPEHGIRAEAQDMEPVQSGTDTISGIPTVSLYGQTEKSLTPEPEDVEDLDTVIVDLQDVGSRYYTYIYTAGLIMKTCGHTDTEVWILDRPNPIRGDRIEGNILEEHLQSFVGMQPIATRHGMTIGELADFFDQYGGWSCDFEVISMEGWSRDQWFDETGLPWVLPSPNMPQLQTASIYPGMCLLEGTNCSEGRGTTRPFEIIGAPYVDPHALKARLDDYELPGIEFRVCSFRPTFQKHAGRNCQGVQLHVTDRNRLKSVATGMATLKALSELNDEFGWRQEAYEFVDDKLAIDLLLGDRQLRRDLMNGAHPLELAEARNDRLNTFLERRKSVLRY